MHCAGSDQIVTHRCGCTTSPFPSSLGESQTKTRPVEKKIQWSVLIKCEMTCEGMLESDWPEGVKNM